MRTLAQLAILLLLVSLSFAQDVSSSIGIKFYGFVKFEAIYDNTELAVGDWMLFARPDNDPRSDQDIFTMNARHTRIGMKLSGPQLGEDGNINALIEVDFAGGFPNSSTAARQPNLRLRHAWVEVAYPMWALRFGQDWALIASPFPNTTSFVVGAGKGNLWMRYPQVSFTFKHDPVKFAVSLNRPMAGNTKYEDFAGGDFDPVGDGERSGMPWMMGRVWYTLGKIGNVSLSGHYGLEQINDKNGTPHDKRTYSLNGDASVKFGPVALTAKGFYGENLNSFFGGVFQGFVANDFTVDNVTSKGGWGQAVYSITKAWAITMGGGFDAPDTDVLSTGNRTRNDWVFGNIAFKLTDQVIFMLEEDYLKTSYKGMDAGNNLRTQFVTYFKF